MRKTEVLVRYQSGEGENIRVETGELVNRGVDINDYGRNYGRVSTRVYVDGRLEREYTDEEEILDFSDIPLLTNRLERLKNVRASSDELISLIDTYIADALNRKEREAEESNF